jgi:hypothetical protein
MSDTSNGPNDRGGVGVPLAVIGGCAAFFAAILLLLGLNGNDDENTAAVGFPIILGVLAVVAVVGALVWRAVSRKRSG